MPEETKQATSRWIGAFLLVMFIIYILVSLGKTAWISWIAVIFGFFITGFLFIQSGIMTYLRKKNYRTLGVGDFIVWITVAVAVGILLNSLLLIQAIRNSAPIWLLNFTTTIGVSVGIIGGLLAIIHLVVPKRFK